MDYVNSVVASLDLSIVGSFAANGAFVAVGSIALFRWLRDRDPRRLNLASIFVFMGATAALDDVRVLLPGNMSIVPRLATLFFMASAVSLLALRHRMIPLRPRVWRAALAGMAAVTLVAMLAPVPAPRSLAYFALAYMVVGAWTLCVMEPAMRFWREARRSPAVQGARLRALAASYTGMAGLLVLAVAGVTFRGFVGAVADIGLVALAGLMYVAADPPGWMKRLWRVREERALQDSLNLLLLMDRDRTAVGTRAVDWAMRLVGASAAILTGTSGELIAQANLEPLVARALALRVMGAQAPGTIRAIHDRTMFIAVIPIGLGRDRVVLAVVSGPYTPVFGTDELTRLEQYGTLVGAALQRVAMVERERAQTSANATLLEGLSRLGEGIVITEAGRMIYANDAYVAMTGYPRTELMKFESLVDLAPEQLRQPLRAQLAERLGGNRLQTRYESQLVARDGHVVDVETVVSLLPEGRHRVLNIVRDISERKNAEVVLRDRERKFRTLLEFAPDGMLITDRAGVIRMVNARTETMFGYPRRELIGREADMLLPEQFRGRRWLSHGESDSKAAAESPMSPVELCGLRSDGSEFPIDVSLGPLETEDGPMMGAAVRDATARRATEDALRRVALTDALTGLPNRRAWDMEIEREMARSERDGRPICVAIIDLDSFKGYNDDWGHQRGDRLLRDVADAWRAALREVDYLARYGGDEFAVLLPACDLESARMVLNRMVATTPERQSCTVGVACHIPGVTARTVDPMAIADEALYTAKREHRGMVHAQSEVTPNSGPVPRWADVIPAVLADHNVRAVYQPIVRLSDDQVFGYEALARMGESPADTSVEELFSAAGRLGFGRDLDWLCRRAALEGSRGIGGGLPLFVNVGAGALLDPVHGVDQMVLLSRWVERSPRDVVLEISERELISDVSRLTAVLAEYRAEGFRFAVDDVGEGFSTLEVLGAANPEFVKLGSSLMRGGSATEAIVRAIMTFANATGAAVIVEGLENDALIDRARHLGIPLGQGYGLARPLEDMPSGGERARRRTSAPPPESSLAS
ncbi:MAG: PAS domain S-box protein [Candidatus Dormibacteria bacterium]